MENHADYRFSVPKGCHFVSHSIFANEALVFCNGSRGAIKATFHIVANYLSESQ